MNELQALLDAEPGPAARRLILAGMLELAARQMDRIAAYEEAQGQVSEAAIDRAKAAMAHAQYRAVRAEVDALIASAGNGKQ